MLVLLVSQAAQDLAHLDGDFLIQRLEEVVGTAVSPFDRIASEVREVEALLAGEALFGRLEIGPDRKLTGIYSLMDDAAAWALIWKRSERWSAPKG